MKYKENVRHQLDRRAKIIIILGIFLSFIVIMIPLWQRGSALSLSLRSAKAEKRIEALDKEERTILSSLSEVEGTGFKEEVSLAMASL